MSWRLYWYIFLFLKDFIKVLKNHLIKKQKAKKLNVSYKFVSCKKFQKYNSQYKWLSASSKYCGLKLKFVQKLYKFH